MEIKSGNGGKNSSPIKQQQDVSAEQLLRTGIESIQEAFERKTISCQQEVQHWKQIAGGQRQQIVQLETELTQMQRKLSECEKVIAELQRDKKEVQVQRQSVLDKYNALKKTTLQLETFRKVVCFHFPTPI